MLVIKNITAIISFLFLLNTCHSQIGFSFNLPMDDKGILLEQEIDESRSNYVFIPNKSHIYYNQSDIIVCDVYHYIEFPKGYNVDIGDILIERYNNTIIVSYKSKDIDYIQYKDFILIWNMSDFIKLLPLMGNP